MKRLAVCGSRGFTDKDRVYKKLSSFNGDIILILGDADGPDTFARQWAEAYDVPYIVLKPANRYYPELWGPKGKLLYLARDMQVVDNCDELVAFWDGQSRGTDFTIKYAISKGIEIHVIRDVA